MRWRHCKGNICTYTWPSVTAVQTTTTTFATLPGSEIAYTPPTGATEVVYMLSIAASTSATSGVYHTRLMIDGVESGASPTIGGAESRQYGTLETIRFVLMHGLVLNFKIRGTASLHWYDICNDYSQT